MQCYTCSIFTEVEEFLEIVVEKHILVHLVQVHFTEGKDTMNTYKAVASSDKPVGRAETAESCRVGMNWEPSHFTRAHGRRVPAALWCSTSPAEPGTNTTVTDRTQMLNYAS